MAWTTKGHVQNYFPPSYISVLGLCLTCYLLQALHSHNEQLVKMQLQKTRNPFPETCMEVAQ